MKARKASILAIRGSKWLALGTIFQWLWQMAVIVILARLLAPGDFGLVAVAALVLNALRGIKSLSLGTALIQRKDDIEEAANAFFFLNCLFSLIIFAAIFSAAPLIAGFFKNSHAVPVVRVLSFQVILEAASAVQRFLTVKELKVKKQISILLGNSFITGVVSIVLAVKGLGAWSLVYGQLSGTACATFLWWLSVKWHPTIHFSWRVAKELLGFGAVVTLSNIFIRAIDEMDKLFVGRFLGVNPSLGLYDLAKRIILMPMQRISLLNQRITLPAFCQIRENREKLRQWYLKILSFCSFLMIPFAVAMVLLADEVVTVILGPKWIPTIPLLKILSVVAWIAAMIECSIPLYVSTGRVNLYLKLVIARFLATVLVLSFTARISLLAVCLGQLGVIAVFGPVSLYLGLKVVGGSLLQLLGVVKTPGIGAVVFGVMLLLFRYLGSYLFAQPNALSLLFIIVPAAAAYFLTIHLLRPQLFSELRKIATTALAPPPKIDERTAG